MWQKYDFSKKNLSESLVFVSETANERFAHINKLFAHSPIYHEQPEGIAHGRSFVMSDLSDSLTAVFFTWATWAICS